MESLGQLKVAAESESRHARAAHQMITAIEAPAKELEEALRKAVHTLSAPAVDEKAVPGQEKAAPTPPAAPRGSGPRPSSTGGTTGSPQPPN